MVAADLDALNQSFQGLNDRVHKRIPCQCTQCRVATIPEFFDQNKLKKRVEDRRLRIECPASYEDVDVLELLDGVRTDAPDWAHVDPAGQLCASCESSWRRRRSCMKTVKRSSCMSVSATTTSASRVSITRLSAGKRF